MAFVFLRCCAAALSWGGGGTAQALAGCFARRDCPIWADSSTTRECHELEEALGGAKAVAEATGSAAYCRFSGNQVNKKKFDVCRFLAVYTSSGRSFVVNIVAKPQTTTRALGFLVSFLNRQHAVPTPCSWCRLPSLHAGHNGYVYVVGTHNFD